MPARATSLIKSTRPSPGVVLLTLNLPQLRNAMTEELTGAWIATMGKVAADRSVRAVVVTGKGSAFCSGADLSWLDQGTTENTPDHLREKMLPFYRAWLAPRYLSVPVIAAVNGPAVGAGLCLALSCDLRYASPEAAFSAPFIGLGTHGGMAASWLLPEAIGVVRAREMLYTGRVVPAAEAVQWGLANEVAADAVARSLEVAQGISLAGPIAVRLTKAGLAQSSHGGLESALQWEALAQPVTMATADIHEGIKARRERRQPSFQGK
jgi:enoyl-CoA hydratase/carnithine racemase